MGAFQLEAWHWWALGLISVVAEAMWPTGLFAGIALSGMAVGLLITFVPGLSWTVQLAIFTAIASVLYFLIQRFFYQGKSDSDASRDERIGEVMGKEFELQSPIMNNYSELEINGTHWELKGRDQKEGTRIRVIGMDGHMLVVVPARQNTDEASILK